MTTINKSAPVLVTGGSGYIAGWIIRYLLEEGRTVHATVRDPGKKASVAHLEAIAAKTPGKLKLFKADLLDARSFDKATAGCELVMHTASPFVIKGFKDANEALVRPAVEGTRNVLETVNRTASVKRVVLTSSVAAIYGDNMDARSVPGGVFTEEHWNATSSVSHQPYSYSKVAAEKEAWKIHDAQTPRRWDLVVLNPGLVMGPSLTPMTQSTSISTISDLGNGRMRTGAPRLMLGLVDVRDVARAHLLAGDTLQAQGRHVISATERSMLEMAGILRERFPAYPFPRKELPKALVWLVGPLSAGISREFVTKNVGYPLKFDNRKSREALGLSYRPIETTLAEHFQQLIDDGLMRKRA